MSNMKIEADPEGHLERKKGIREIYKGLKRTVESAAVFNKIMYMQEKDDLNKYYYED